MIVLLNKEACFKTNELKYSFPSVLSSLLQEFDYIFSKETPNKLLPIRGIEHQIDCIPGTSIPNRPAYRSNLEEKKELQWES